MIKKMSHKHFCDGLYSSRLRHISGFLPTADPEMSLEILTFYLLTFSNVTPPQFIMSSPDTNASDNASYCLLYIMDY